MPTFYSTCAAGLESVARRMASKAIPGFHFHQSLAGALVYSAKAFKPDCAFFQNTYLLVARYDRTGDLTSAARRALNDKRHFSDLSRAMKQYHFRTFRVMFSDANTLTSVDPTVRAAMERGVRDAKVDRARPDTEVLLLRRSEGFALLLLRLTRNPDKAARGELAPGIAQCMAFLARPAPEGVFLDPFAGHGALGAARKAIGPYKAIHMIDKKADARKGARGAAVVAGDALRLDERFGKGSVTEIVTDPPWGIYEPLPMAADAFYAKLLEQFAFVLAPGGTLVLLTADKRNYERAIARRADAFEAVETHDLLVNGKKAAIYVSRRRG